MYIFHLVMTLFLGFKGAGPCLTACRGPCHICGTNTWGDLGQAITWWPRMGVWSLSAVEEQKKSQFWKTTCPQHATTPRLGQRLCHTGILPGKYRTKQEARSLSAAVVSCSVWREDLGQQMGFPRPRA